MNEWKPLPRPKPVGARWVLGICAVPPCYSGLETAANSSAEGTP